MDTVQSLENKVISGSHITEQEALLLYESPLEELSQAADAIRKYFMGNQFDLCSIINGKSGKCPENCKYCAQSSFYSTASETYPILGKEEIIREACIRAEQGIPRYSIVTSGKKLSDREVELMCDTVRELKERADISVCVSFGLLDGRQFKKLKEAGVSRVHNNLETSRAYFPKVCTTHSYDDKLGTIQAAFQAGLSVCSGGIMGLGETVKDRIEMAFELKRLKIRSVPLNMLNPIPGTPYENNRRLSAGDMRRICAVYRFILPKAFIRLAGGRGLLEDRGESCFTSGANAVISGDMLTTSGYTAASDLAMVKKLGYKIIRSRDNGALRIRERR